MNSIKPLKLAAIPLAALCLAPLSCLAQSNQGALVEVVTLVVRPGMTAKFEQGMKQVATYAQSHGDTTGWSTYEIMYGPDEGNITILIPFKWESVDNPPSYEAGLGQTVTKSVGPYLSSFHTELVRELSNLSSPPAANSAAQKYWEVLDLRLAPGKADTFLATVRQLAEAEKKFNPSPNPVELYETVAGGDADDVTVAIGHPNFADFGHEGKSNIEVLTQAYGAPAALAIESALSNTIASEYVTIVRYRPDLSLTTSGGQ
jgi:hypothetical protein